MTTKLLTLDIDKLRCAANKRATTGKRARRKLYVLERDGYKCTNCNSNDNLTIAHIIPPKKSRNRNASHYNPKFCKTLCERCHLYEHSQEGGKQNANKRMEKNEELE